MLDASSLIMFRHAMHVIAALYGPSTYSALNV